MIKKILGGPLPILGNLLPMIPSAPTAEPASCTCGCGCSSNVRGTRDGAGSIVSDA